VNVLKHYPVTLSVADFKFVHCNNILSLSQGDLMELSNWVNSILFAQFFDILYWVCSWRKNEVNWSGGCGVQVRGVEDLKGIASRVTVDIVVSIWKGLSDEVVEGNCDSVWSQASDDQKFLEQSLIESLPVERQLLVFWSKFIVPVLENVWSISLQVGGKLVKSFKFNELLDMEPSNIWKPLLEVSWVRNVSSKRSLEQEVHLLLVVVNLNNLLLHKSEGDHTSEDLLVLFEQTSGYPLVNGHSDHGSEGKYSLLVIFDELSLLNSLEEEGVKRLKRVLVHVVNDLQLDQQEVKHGSFRSNSSVNFSGQVNLNFCLSSLSLLDLDFSGSFLSSFKRLNQSMVGENSSLVSICQVLQKTCF